MTQFATVVVGKLLNCRSDLSQEVYRQCRGNVSRGSECRQCLQRRWFYGLEVTTIVPVQVYKGLLSGALRHVLLVDSFELSVNLSSNVRKVLQCTQGVQLRGQGEPQLGCQLIIQIYLEALLRDLHYTYKVQELGLKLEEGLSRDYRQTIILLLGFSSLIRVYKSSFEVVQHLVYTYKQISSSIVVT